MTQPKMAMIGMAVMGSNFAQNFAEKGYPIALFNRTDARTRERYEAIPDEVEYKKRLFPVYGEIRNLVDLVGRDGIYFIMVKAGATQAVLDQLVPLLGSDAVVVNCANEHWRETERMCRELEGKVHFYGMGVSGGEEGARHGPSMMPGGGSLEVYNARLKEPLEAVAAKAPQDGAPCVAYIGRGGAGHFVKMVHNGIEYGDMELIAETYDLMRKALGMSAPEIGDVFARWNEGDLQSYLVEITADILHHKDPSADGYLVDHILDRAQMKGTGTWTVISSLELESGVYPVPTIYAAVETRAISSFRDLRLRMARELSLPPRPYTGDREALIQDLERALLVAKIASYTQGIGLMQAADREHDFGGLNIAEIARIWRAGCIIRARFLGEITEAYRSDPELPSLIVAPRFREWVQEGFTALTRVCTVAAECRVPAMAFNASRDFILQLASEQLPTNLTQGQRDYFGAHTYERIDRPGRFHTDWPRPGRPELPAEE
ncbi:MAG: 6-phosphogluconate dehydrogenase, decarboxylating [Candidatus Poribacteria bacterium]|nr:MAG: 6-phosphogluconate dehydrogenase, decarboxylating [Candidatus Poribacteria bacterium]